MESVLGRGDTDNISSQVFEFQAPQRGNSVAEKDDVTPELEIAML